MRDNLTDFQNQLDNIKAYLDCLQIETELLSLDLSNYAQKVEILAKYQEQVYLTRSKRRLDYSSVVIALYSAFEQFIQDIVQAYLRLLNKIIPAYTQLPNKITDNHIDLSCKLMGTLEYSPYQNLTSVRNIVANLNSCLNNETGYQLNTYAFTQHRANFRQNELNRLFGNIGIRNIDQKIINSLAFKDYLKQIYPDIPYESFKKTSKNKIETDWSRKAFSSLNDLIVRRNEIAHGRPADILPISSLQDYVMFFKHYSEGLYQALQQAIIPSIKQHRSTPLNSPFKVIQAGRVAGFEINTAISVGDWLIAELPDNPHRFGQIEQLQINDEEVSTATDGKVGVQIPFKAKENQRFFLVRRRDMPAI